MKLIAYACIAGLLTTLVCAAAQADEAADQYAVAAAHYGHARWELALAEFEKFLKNFPAHDKADQASFYMGESLVQLRRFKEASQQFRTLVDRQPDEPLARKVLFRAGEASYFAGELDKAQPALTEFLKRHPDDKLNAYVLPYLGDMALEQGSTLEAEELYRRALSEFPDGRLQDDCRFGLARALEQQGKIEQACGIYRSLARKPGAAWADEAQYRLGRHAYDQGDFEASLEAWAAFDREMAGSSLAPQARLARAQALFQLRRWPEAEAALKPLTTAKELAVEARYWLGLVQKARGEWAAAAETLLAAAATNPQHALAPAITFHAGDALLLAGKPAEARKQFERVSQSWPDDALADDALLGQMRAALAQSDGASIDEGALAFKEHFAESGLLHDAKRVQARSLLSRHKFAEAAAILEPLVLTGLAIAAPETLPDRYLLALAYQGLARPDETLALLEPVLKAADHELAADAVRLKAAAQFAAKKYAEAIATLKQFLDTNPHGDALVEARAELAVCYASTKQFEQSRSLYAELVKDKVAPKLLDPVRLALAEIALASGEHAWASELFAEVAKSSQVPDKAAKALAGLGFSHLKSGKDALALEAFTKLLEKYPGEPPAAEAAFARAELLAKTKQPQALEAYRAVFEKYAKSRQAPSALLAAARLEEQAGKLDPARTLYERFERDYANSTQLDESLYNHAWVLRSLNQPAEADALFEKICKRFPKSRFRLDAMYRLAEDAGALGNKAVAMQWISTLLAEKPNADITSHALYLAAQQSIAAESWKDTIELLTTLLKDYPQTELAVLAEFWIAESKYRLGQYDESQAAFDRLAAHLPKSRESWTAMVPLRRAQILVHQKKWTEAEPLARSIAKEFPDFDQQYEADYVVGRCLAAGGRFDEARKVFNQVVHSQSGGKTETAAMAQWMIGESYFHQKNYESAIREYLRLEILYAYPTWQAGALLQAGKCHEAMGEWPQAVELYARLLKNYPGNTFSNEATRRLQTAQGRVKKG